MGRWGGWCGAVAVALPACAAGQADAGVGGGHLTHSSSSADPSGFHTFNALSKSPAAPPCAGLSHPAAMLAHRSQPTRGRPWPPYQHQPWSSDRARSSNVPRPDAFRPP